MILSYSCYPSQSKFGFSLSPFILSIRLSSRLVPVYHILLFFSSVPVQNWFQLILFFYSFQSKIGSSLSYPCILSIRYSSILVPVYHILNYSINPLQFQIGPSFISFYSINPLQLQIGPSLSYPFILSIRYSSRLVQVYHILLFYQSVLVLYWSQFIISFYSINPLQL